MIINSVSYRDGKMLISSIENMNQFCKYVSEVTGRKVKLYFEKNTDKHTKEC